MNNEHVRFPRAPWPSLSYRRCVHISWLDLFITSSSSHALFWRNYCSRGMRVYWSQVLCNRSKQSYWIPHLLNTFMIVPPGLLSKRLQNIWYNPSKRSPLITACGMISKTLCRQIAPGEECAHVYVIFSLSSSLPLTLKCRKCVVCAKASFHGNVTRVRIEQFYFPKWR